MREGGWEGGRQDGEERIVMKSPAAQGRNAIIAKRRVRLNRLIDIL